LFLLPPPNLPPTVTGENSVVSGVSIGLQLIPETTGGSSLRRPDTDGFINRRNRLTTSSRTSINTNLLYCRHVTNHHLRTAAVTGKGTEGQTGNLNEYWSTRTTLTVANESPMRYYGCMWRVTVSILKWPWKKIVVWIVKIAQAIIDFLPDPRPPTPKP